jgi:7-cyano-7-deazaguanine synthase in queuosine biosynthesis
MDETSGKPGTVFAQGFDQTLLGDLSSRSDDLYRIACAIFAADQEVRRGGARDPHDDQWMRHFGLCIDVQDLGFWSQDDVQTALSELIRFATGDRWRFCFSQAATSVYRRRQLQFGFERQPLNEPPGCVVLFSGGIDSLAVLAQCAAAGEQPLAISQWGEVGTQTRQQNLITYLKVFPPTLSAMNHWSFPHIQAEIHSKGPEARERTRRSRAVLFGALGSIVAGELGIERVYLADNGPISLNLPINSQIVGAHASRSTHPRFLAAMSALARLVYPNTAIHLSNPLWNKTRAETIQQLMQFAPPELLAQTLSCSSWRALPARTPQCGICSQCIDRRVAMIAIGLERYEPGEGYRHDAFAGSLTSEEGRVLTYSYVRFAQRIARMSMEQLVAAFPELLTAARYHDRPVEVVLGNYAELLQRHAQMVLAGLERVIEANRSRWLMRELPADCVLMLLMGDPNAIASDVPAMDDFMALQGPADHELIFDEHAIFARKGNQWLLTFRGQSVWLAHEAGYPRIQFLLTHQQREWDPVTVDHYTRAPKQLPDRDLRVEKAQRSELDVHPPLPLVKERPLSPEEITALDTEIACLRKVLAEAIDLNAQTAIDAAKRRIAELESLKPSLSLANKAVNEPDDFSLTVDKISKSVRRAKAVLKVQHPAFHDHLDAFLHVGIGNWYRPNAVITWSTTIPPDGK